MRRSGGRRKFIEEEIDSGNPAVADNREIGAGIGGLLAGTARYPADAARMTDLFRRRERSILTVGMGGLDHAGDAVDLIAAAMNAAIGIVEHRVRMKDLVDHGAPAL